jgi:tRNA(His) guanylyltransferase
VYLTGSFLIRQSSALYNRRRRYVYQLTHVRTVSDTRSKIESSIVSLFTSAYVFYWPTYFPNLPMVYPPSFDSRAVLYPSPQQVRDYFSWRQADSESQSNAMDNFADGLAHINNLQNTAFWALVKSGQSTQEANKAVQVRSKRLCDKLS